MKVIMLSGPSSSGKTTVINEVFKMLTGSYYNPNNRHKDFECTIKYQSKIITFKSTGDLSCDPIVAMKKYDALNSDILVCAHNTNKVNPLKEILKYNHIVILKSHTYKDNASCIVDANLIFCEI